MTFATFTLAAARERPLLWLLLGIAGLALLAWTYSGMFRRSGNHLAWKLLLLRAAGLAALALALAKPTWSGEMVTVESGRVAVVVDTSLSMSLADPSGPSRYALAKQFVEKFTRSVESGSGPRLAVDLFDINGQPLANGLPSAPTAERTDLARAVTESVARLRSRQLSGVVLVSDGMDNTGRTDFRELARVPVPVFTVGFQDRPEAGGMDLAIRRVQAPERAMVNNEIKLDVQVTKVGGPATNATVTLKRGREVFLSEPVALKADRDEQTVTLTYRPTQPGSFVYAATIEAEGTGEKNLVNNTALFPLRVDAEPIRILYLEGFLRYEFKFLKARLEDDPDVALVSVVRRTNPERIDARTDGDLMTAERLKTIDVVILGDMEAGYLNAAEYDALMKWLDGKNKALVVLGGYTSFGEQGFRTTPLREVLPVTFAEKPPFQSEEAFQLRLTEDGRRHPVFELSRDRVKDAEAWDNAPPLLGQCLVAGPKPGASVLAENPAVMVDGKPAVAMAVQRYGGGMTMVIAPDTLWRWSRVARLSGRSDTLYARFWSQLVRWLAGRSLDDQRPLLTVSTDRADYEVNKPVSVRVQRNPRPDADLTGVEVALEVTTPAGKVVPVPVQAGSAEPDVFVGTFYPPGGGRYEVAAALTAQGKPLANQTVEFLVQGSDRELANTGTDPSNLRTIAAATGGQAFDVERADDLAEKLPRKERRVAREQRIEYWNSPWLFLAFLGCVTVEWVLRRRNHLV